MHVLIAHSFYRVPGGEDQHVREQVGLLSKRHEVRLLAAENSGLRPTGALIRMAYSPATVDVVQNALSEERTDLLHVHNVYPALGIAPFVAAARASVPVVMTVHNYRLRCPNGYMFTEGEICTRCERGNYINAVVHHCFPSRKQAVVYASSLWIHRFLARIERYVSIFLTPSSFMRETLLRWGIAPERVALVRHHVTADATGDPTASDEGLYLGRLSSEKGLDVMLSALQQIGNPPFVIAGSGPLEKATRETAGRLGLTNVRFIGQVDRDTARQLLSRARYVVVPSSVQETASLTAMEALAHARPLIVSDVGALPELVAETRGLMFGAGDARSLADRLQRVIDDDDLCSKMGDAGIAFARSVLTPEAHLDALENAYSAAVARRPPLSPRSPDLPER